ncbi:hypothetical protein G6F40_017900 [Rhizopus arrhizus]|nr:hypothetical protein G6F40_017900 [Rhizopus arrhizus]
MPCAAAQAYRRAALRDHVAGLVCIGKGKAHGNPGRAAGHPHIEVGVTRMAASSAQVGGLHLRQLHRHIIQRAGLNAHRHRR